MGSVSVKNKKRSEYSEPSRSSRAKHPAIASACSVYDDSSNLEKLAIMDNALAKCQNTFILGPELTLMLFTMGILNHPFTILLCLTFRTST
jgi:hypothetical protein